MIRFYCDVSNTEKIIYDSFRQMIRIWSHKLWNQHLNSIRRRAFRTKVLSSERASIISYLIVPSPDKLCYGVILLTLLYSYVAISICRYQIKDHVWFCKFKTVIMTGQCFALFLPPPEKEKLEQNKDKTVEQKSFLLR